MFIRFGETGAQPLPFETEIRNFLRQDSLSFPPRGATLFIGSSSFRFWKSVQDDFPGTTIINRGFGGSSLPHVSLYADLIIFPYQPGHIVIYCGENDFTSADSVTAPMVADRFGKLFHQIRERLPDVRISFISIKPSPSRKQLLPEIRQANQLIRDFLTTQTHADFINVFDDMLDNRGRPRGELFLPDSLHMNRGGYVLWIKAIDPYLRKK